MIAVYVISLLSPWVLRKTLENVNKYKLLSYF